MKKIIILTMVFVLTMGIFVNKNANAATEEDIAAAVGLDVKSDDYMREWQPIMKEYSQGNYLGAIPLLQKYQKKHKNNPVARYLLALCYHNLGYKSSAKVEYQKLVDNESNERYVYYAEKGIACIDDPKSEMCTGKMVAPELTEMEKAQKERITQLEQQLKELEDKNAPKATPDDDISLFIKSKQKIHPAAMDRITIERMERKLQEAEYKKMQAQQESR